MNNNVLILFYLFTVKYYLARSIPILGEDILFDLSISHLVIKSQKNISINKIKTPLCAQQIYCTKWFMEMGKNIMP